MLDRKGAIAFGELAPGIVARAKNGDEDAFRVIFTRYGRPILSFINNLVRDKDMADDLAQETFVRAHRSLGALREDARFSTWLFGIARNVVYEARRQTIKDERNIGLDEPESLRLESSQMRPETVLQGRELNVAIGKALEGLDVDKRTVFTLKIFHEKSYEEISAITGHSVGKLKTDLHRARAEMRKLIAPFLEDSRGV
jgi:RNA polymerase sigma-70 factor (ECF subfamily)